MSSHIYASVSEFCLHRACGGHSDATTRPSLNLEDSNNLSSDQLHPMSEDEIEHSFTEDITINPSSREAEIGPKFKVISQKKSQAPISSLVPPSPLVVQTPLPVQGSILAFTVSLEVERSLSNAPVSDKHSGKQAVEGPSKRHKKKLETSSTSTLSMIEQAKL